MRLYIYSSVSIYAIEGLLGKECWNMILLSQFSPSVFRLFFYLRQHWWCAFCCWDISQYSCSVVHAISQACQISPLFIYSLFGRVFNLFCPNLPLPTASDRASENSHMTLSNVKKKRKRFFPFPSPGDRLIRTLASLLRERYQCAPLGMWEFAQTYVQFLSVVCWSLFLSPQLVQIHFARQL